jgi:hypothetical protein
MKRTTTVREYDEKGRVVKETTTVVEDREPMTPVVPPVYPGRWPCPSQPPPTWPSRIWCMQTILSNRTEDGQ